jgi:hypothetical protein
MTKWKPIKGAPKGTPILVYGKPTDVEGLKFQSSGVFTAYWDSVDGSFCLSGATWEGPFIKPTHWMPLPTAPSAHQ